MHKKLTHLIYFAIATNYFNVFMSTAVLLGLTSFEKIGGQRIFGGASELNVEGCVFIVYTSETLVDSIV